SGRRPAESRDHASVGAGRLPRRGTKRGMTGSFRASNSFAPPAIPGNTSVCRPMRTPGRLLLALIYLLLAAAGSALSRQNAEHCIEPQKVSPQAKAGDHAPRDIGQHAVNATYMNIADVYLDVRHPGSLDAIAERIAGVREASRIHDEAARAHVGRLVNSIDRRALDVGVEDV